MSDGLAERVVRRAIAALANSYGAAPARATAAKELLVHALEGESEEADAVDGYAAAAALAALAHGIEAEAGRGLDWLSVAALQEWDFHHPESPISAGPRTAARPPVRCRENAPAPRPWTPAPRLPPGGYRP